MRWSIPSDSNHLGIEEVVALLTASPLVDGIAEFGSRALHQTSPSSDYDLLLLVDQLPAPVFQLVTSIGGQLADIVLVETETVDNVLQRGQFPARRSFEGLFVQKMQTARIVYDVSGRLGRIKDLATNDAWLAEFVQQDTTVRDLSSVWFWQSFGLLHLDRMAQSSAPVHALAMDMMLTSCLSGTWRSYFEIRGMTWEGEKAAIRYWSKYDQDYLDAVQSLMAVHDREERLARYRALVERTLEPIGEPFGRGETALVLSCAARDGDEIERTLAYWSSLFASSSESA